MTLSKVRFFALVSRSSLGEGGRAEASESGGGLEGRLFDFLRNVLLLLGAIQRDVVDDAAE